MQTQFGPLLKNWRETRRLSQLDLGLSANVSARHISFLETGRAQPSRDMVLHLAENLEVPRGSRNTMLHAAGFAPAYQARSFDDENLGKVREAVNWVLSRHDPYPAMLLDRHWRVLRANRCAKRLLSGAGIDVAAQESLLTLFADPKHLSTIIENWEEVARHMVRRLRTEVAHFGGDDVLEEHARTMETLVGKPDFDDVSLLAPVVPAIYKAGDIRLSLFSTISQFGTAEDIAVAELKIEHMFPADEFTCETLVAMAG